MGYLYGYIVPNRNFLVILVLLCQLICDWIVIVTKSIVQTFQGKEYDVCMFRRLKQTDKCGKTRLTLDTIF
jgi:hypothetical protein